VNSLVNEKYYCFIDEKGNFSHEVRKYRTVEPAVETTPKVESEEVVENVSSQPREIVEEFVTAAEVGEPNPADDPVRNQCQQIKIMLESEGKPVTKSSMRTKVIQLINDEVLPSENRPLLIDYINKHCPEELE